MLKNSQKAFIVNVFYQYLFSQVGVRHIILAVSYRAEQVEDELKYLEKSVSIIYGTFMFTYCYLSNLH